MTAKPKYATEESVEECKQRLDDVEHALSLPHKHLTVEEVLEKLPRSCGIAWAALILSTFLSVCVIYLLIPRKAAESKPVATVAEVPIAQLSASKSVDDQWLAPTPKTTVSVVSSVECWVGVYDCDKDNQIISEETLPVGQSLNMYDEADKKYTVRSGCPGKVAYFIDGNERYPENRSKTPEKSEVVELP